MRDPSLHLAQCGRMPDGVLMGGTAMTYFLANAQVLDEVPDPALYWTPIQFFQHLRAIRSSTDSSAAGHPLGVLRLPFGLRARRVHLSEIY